MTPELHILGGIDEAGLGPILGPLVAAGLVLAGPVGRSPWQALSSSFCRRKTSRDDTRIRVDDSKKVKVGSHGLAELERTALSLHHAATGRLPHTLGELLAGTIAPFDAGAYPWYADVHRAQLPRWQPRDTLELQAHLAARGMQRSGITALAYPCRVVDVADFNALIREHDNKGLAHWQVTLSVLRACLAAAEGHDAPQTLVIDRQGGRGHYRSLLTRAFPDRPVVTLSEGASVSRYRLGARTELVFSENGEARAFPTAAASCLAKYVRELLVEQLNAWFTARRPGLRPTAGYYTDGRRFLDDLGTLREQVPTDLLVRIR
jgi:ribonuclease HII